MLGLKPTMHLVEQLLINKLKNTGKCIIEDFGTHRKDSQVVNL